MKPINNHIELLNLIAKGNTEDLLYQKDLTNNLNALVAIGLVEICEGRILMTAKGELVRKKKTLIPYETTRDQKDKEKISSSNRKRKSVYIYLFLIILCTASVYLSFLLMQGF